MPGAEWCYSHHPDYQEERRRNAQKGGKRGGKGRGSPSELQGLKGLLEELTDRVIGKEGVERLETGRAAVANQLINTRLRAVEAERKIREQEEIIERIEQLERAAEAPRGGRRWGG